MAFTECHPCVSLPVGTGSRGSRTFAVLGVFESSLSLSLRPRKSEEVEISTTCFMINDAHGSMNIIWTFFMCLLQLITILPPHAL